MGVVWLNGSVVDQNDARVLVADRGFTLADGIFETIKASVLDFAPPSDDISIVVIRVDCQRAGAGFREQGCALGNRFERLFVVLRKSARGRSSANIEIGEKQTIN